MISSVSLSHIEQECVWRVLYKKKNSHTHYFKASGWKWCYDFLLKNVNDSLVLNHPGVFSPKIPIKLCGEHESNMWVVE